jgi:leucyl-tRNA synthetase
MGDLEDKLNMDTKEWRAVETKWQEKWAQNNLYEANVQPGKPKFFVNFPYPYVNGLLHVGHAYSASRCDVLARFKKMNGYNVLFPQGWHCTGTPITAAARRVKEGEESQIHALELMGFSKEEIPKFIEPKHWVKIFTPLAREDFNELGVGIDWRREFLTSDINPAYDKFIRWQFEKLREKNCVVKGKHPVVWCPNDKMPVGDHDRSEGEGEVPQEFTLLKFKLDDYFLVAATLRPETVYGQTNLWVNPDTEYTIIKTDNEKWIISSDCAEKLKLQKEKIELIGHISGREFIGKKVEAPGANRIIPILPATFCDPKFGTGIVTSVPSDAPYDYIALKDLQNDKDKLAEYNLNFDEIQAIKPIPIIKSKDGEDLPAIKAIEKLKIKNQNDPQLEELTNKIYKEGFYRGVMNENCSKFSGQLVEAAKNGVKAELLAAKKADTFYELSGKVTCRCLTPSTVKIVSDQWFIKYSDKDWKNSTKDALSKLRLYPELARAQFEYAVDWLKDWACVRERGTGTKLPWDEKWTIESLSDSTIYMAYYTIAKYLEHPKEYGINISKLNNSFFDYIFLNKGKAADLSKKLEIPEKTLKEIKTEFEYWYPFDFRGSGKDLIQNHLPFCLFNHTAIFPEKFWPKGFGINGWLLVEGEKMAKSKGNFYSIRDILKKYSADATRIALVASAEGMDDPNFNLRSAENWQKKLTNWYNFALENYQKGSAERDSLDDWLESVINKNIKDATQAFEETMFRTALSKGFFEIQNNLRWYFRRKGQQPNKETLVKVIEYQTKILTPFAPHITEEIWSKLGKKGFISTSDWPQYDAKKENREAEQKENMLKNALDDIYGVIKFTAKKGAKPAKLFLYTIPSEFAVYDSARQFLSKDLKLGVQIYSIADKNKYDPKNKSARAKPGKPGIYIESSNNYFSNELAKR